MFSSFRRWFARRFWYVQPQLTLLVRLPLRQLPAILAVAAKPSQERLHLQEVFMDGRRYQIEPTADGFSILTTSKSYWRYTEGMLRVQRRTRAAARLVGRTFDAGAGLTRLEVRSHIRMGYLLDVLWIPLFFSAIIVGIPWMWWVAAVLVAILFSLSYSYHHYQAAYQANEMIFFLNKALQDHLVHDLPELGALSEDVMYGGGAFASEWERFYEARRDD